MTSTGGPAHTLLVVDDDPTIIQMLTVALGRAGYEVVGVESGAEALAYFREHRDSVHAVLTDIIMPGMGGEELLEKILDLNPRAKVVATSGAADPDTIARMSRAGLAGFLPKPYRPQELPALLERALGGVG